MRSFRVKAKINTKEESERTRYGLTRPMMIANIVLRSSRMCMGDKEKAFKRKTEWGKERIGVVVKRTEEKESILYNVASSSRLR